MKLIHCSDLHLDSKMQANFAAKEARLRQDEILNNFARLIDYAKNNGVDAILICGDMFDTNFPSVKAVEYCIGEIKKSSGINFYLIYGNHDEAEIFSKVSLPNLHTFGSSWVSYDLGGVTVTGQNAGDIDFSSLNLSADTVNIVMLHGQEAESDGEEVVNVKKAAGKNIDYLALGHIHTYKTAKLDGRGIYAYSGCLEGRGFDEAGEKGFITLEISGKKINPTFVPFAKRTIYQVDVDISGLTKFNDIESKVASSVAHIEDKDIVSLVLSGTYTIETRKDLIMLNNTVLNRFFYARIKDKTTLYIDIKEYENDLSLKGEFIRKVYAAELTDEQKAAVITAGIKALAGEDME